MWTIFLRVMALASLFIALSWGVSAADYCIRCVVPCPYDGNPTAWVECGTCNGATKMCRCRWGCGHYSYWHECDCEPIWEPGCFLEGTGILMEDGSTKPIESVRAGDVVLGYDDLNSRMVAAKVLAVHNPTTADAYFVVNGTLRVTATQPFLSRGKWIRLGDLAVGDPLTAADGTEPAILDLHRVDKKVTVFNLQVDTVAS